MHLLHFYYITFITYLLNAYLIYAFITYLLKSSYNA